MLTGLPYGHYFGMSSWVIVANNSVIPLSNYDVIFHNNSTEGTAFIVTHAAQRQFDSHLHELRI